LIIFSFSGALNVFTFSSTSDGAISVFNVAFVFNVAVNFLVSLRSIPTSYGNFCGSVEAVFITELLLL